MPSSYRRVWRHVRTEIEKLVRSAQAKLGADEVCFVIASDHGEYLGEMNRTHHGHWLGPELVRVPLVSIVPGQAPGQVLDPVGTIDVASTLALLAGVTLPQAEGIPLLSPNAAELTRRPIVMGESMELGVVLGDHRLVLDPSRDLIRLFDDGHGGKELGREAHGERVGELLELLLGSPVARQ
jgi:membrane-anchored protein YejM (alkaline phosphatase superfamily)